MDSYKHWELQNYTPKIVKICTYDSVYKQNMIKGPDTDLIDLSTLHQPFCASYLQKIFLLRC